MKGCILPSSASERIIKATNAVIGRNHVEELRDLLGHDVLLLHCPWGFKECFENWGSFTIGCMNDPAYLARLAKGNIGVALGERSGGLCTIDVDNDGEIPGFLRSNRILEETLMTKGNRGGNFWFRVRGMCPHSKTLRRHGQKWGEFRSNGNQTIIYGMHPEGIRYRIVQSHAPVTLDFNEIKWPDGMTGVPKVHRTDDTEETDDTNAIDESHVTQEVSAFVCALSLSHFPKELINRSLPTEVHTNHGCLFRLAREIKTYEREHSGQFNCETLRSIFDQWYADAHAFLRPEQTKDEYFMEFMAGYRRVKYLIGEEVLMKAWERANPGKFPQEIMKLVDQKQMHLLAAFCRELQREWGDKPFFLSCRMVQRLFDPVSLSTASLWLRGLEALGIIRTVKKGGPDTNKASRFLYLLPLD